MSLRVVNLYAGPGTGKSTTAAALFAELKYRGINTELITEYAKDAAWEKRGAKLFSAQEYIFGKQHFRMSRVVDQVDFVITDSPLLLGMVYVPDDYFLTKLRELVSEAYHSYENIDIFLRRNKPYNPIGRNQTEDQAKVLDQKIKQMLLSEKVDFTELDFSRENVNQIIKMLEDRGWIPKQEPQEFNTVKSFHYLWTKCVGSPDYDKSAWMNICKQLNKIGIMV